MEHEGTEFAAVVETTRFLHYFKDMPDYRQPGKVDYPLAEILLLCLMAVLAGAEAFTDIARFGEKKIDLLRRFRPFQNGTPSHDHLGDIFATLDAQAFQHCFVAWVAATTNTPAGVIAIDGKTSRRSYQKKGSKDAIHIVSAFAARQRLVLGQVKVNEKSNENIAIPALLDMMAIEGAVVTIDAIATKPLLCAGLPARHCGKDHRQESRLHPGAERQPGQLARRCRTVRQRADSQSFQGYYGQHTQDGRRRPWSHRNPEMYCRQRRQMVAGSSQLARTERPRHYRKRARNRWKINP